MNAGMNKIKIGNYTVPVYIPENCNEDTRFVIYYNGSGGPYPDRTPLETELKNNGSDAVVIFAGNANYDPMVAVNQVAEQYNIDELHVTPVGFSMGSHFSTNKLVKIIEENPDIPSQVLVHLDGACTSLPSTLKKSIPALLKNDTIVISVLRKNNQYQKEYMKLAEAGVNVLFVKSKHNDHVRVNKEFFSKGNLNLLAGTGELTDMYSISVYDKETGGLRELNYNDINDLEKIYDYFGIETGIEYKLKKLLSLNNISLENLSISTDTDILKQPFNDIIGKIKNTSLLQSSSQSATSFASTTKFPQQIPNVVNIHFEGTVELLYKLAKNMKEFAKIGPLIDKIDRNLANEATQLLEQQNSNQVPQATTLSATNQAETTEKINTETTLDTTTKEVVSTPTSVVLDNGTPISVGASAAIAAGINGVFSNFTNSETKINQIEPTIEVTETKNEEIKNNQGTESRTTQYVTTSSNNTNNTTVTSNTGTSTTSESVSNQNDIQTNTSQDTANTNTYPLDEFPKYEEIYSDESRIVYNYNNEYKIIIHKDGNQIIGIEHYYDFKDEQSAISALENLKTDYTNTDYMENVMQQGRYVKVIFSEEMYNNLTINEIKDKYSGLPEIIKL